METRHESNRPDGRLRQFRARGGREPWVTKKQIALHFQVSEEAGELWVDAGMPCLRSPGDGP